MKFLRTHWIKFVVSIPLLCLAIVAAGILSAFWIEWQATSAWSSKRLPFEQKVWLAEQDSEEMDPVRLRMIDDLLERHELVGLTQKEVENLLGSQIGTKYFRDWDMAYWLGPERGSTRIDSEWLVIKLDENGIVSDRKIVRD